MAQININDFNTPDIIKNLPTFDGKCNELNSFINCVNQVAVFLPQAPENVRPFWLSAIRNKITGAANERLRLYGEPGTWENIREVLKLHFSDHRDVRTLYNQLNLLKQTGQVQTFYDQILELVTALNDKARIANNDNAVVRQAIIDRNLNEGLQVFLNGVREPLRTILLSRNPTTLNGAYAIAMQLQPELPFKPQRTPSNNFTNQNSRYNTNYSQPRYHFNNPNHFNNNNPNQSHNHFNNHNQFPNFNNPNHFPNQFNPNNFNHNQYANPNSVNRRHNFNNNNNNQVEPMEVDQSTSNTRRQANNNNNRANFNNAFRGQPNNNPSVSRNVIPPIPQNNNNHLVVEELMHNENFQQAGAPPPAT